MALFEQTTLADEGIVAAVCVYTYDDKSLGILCCSDIHMHL